MKKMKNLIKISSDFSSSSSRFSIVKKSDLYHKNSLDTVMLLSFKSISVSLVQKLTVASLSDSSNDVSKITLVLLNKEIHPKLSYLKYWARKMTLRDSPKTTKIVNCNC